ncbi:ATP-binding protein [Caloramator sp. ALD01]|uniref:ATP-binding protein n=1 Tax=Caloramator sp. ALD01 TaxID=1031288 RepID=UPI00273833E8|nr:ATP-binding protein [Caloramator sp. ALD01]
MSGILEYTNYLKLTFIKSKIDELLKEATLNDMSYEEFLYRLLQGEYDRRIDNLKKNRIRMAEFPYKKYLEDLIVEELPEDAQKKLKLLESLEFIKEGQNIILSGNPGTGKTHLAISFGIKACMEGYKVLFTTVPFFCK